MGVSLSFILDGLSYFFGLMITLIGALVFLYSRYYMTGPKEEYGRFYMYLLLFMGTMLGCIFSNNMITFFVFWELTSIFSFCLIGFKYADPEHQKSALTALVVTIGTGLFLLVGCVIAGMGLQTFQISEMVSRYFTLPPVWFTIMLVCILIGAFGKSAQFPFHFWLPSAMKAPVPVSTFLHSAAMVKLGIYAIARFYPILSNHPMWAPLLITIGTLSMTWGAVRAVLSHQIKEILAYSTVSQLGLLVLFYGL